MWNKILTSIQTVPMLLVIFYLSSANIVKTLYNGCCSIECQKINSLSLEKQKNLRRGKKKPVKGFIKKI